MMKRKPSLFLLSLLLAACQSSQLSAPAYAAWVREHRADLTTTATAQPITASLTYLPADWLAVNEAGAEHPEQIAVARREYEGCAWRRLQVKAICCNWMRAVQIRITSACNIFLLDYSRIYDF